MIDSENDGKNAIYNLKLNAGAGQCAFWCTPLLYRQLAYDYAFTVGQCVRGFTMSHFIRWRWVAAKPIPLSPMCTPDRAEPCKKEANVLAACKRGSYLIPKRMILTTEHSMMVLICAHLIHFWLAKCDDHLPICGSMFDTSCGSIRAGECFVSDDLGVNFSLYEDDNTSKYNWPYAYVPRGRSRERLEQNVCCYQMIILLLKMSCRV